MWLTLIRLKLPYITLKLVCLLSVPLIPFEFEQILARKYWCWTELCIIGLTDESYVMMLWRNLELQSREAFKEAVCVCSHVYYCWKSEDIHFQTIITRPCDKCQEFSTCQLKSIYFSAYDIFIDKNSTQYKSTFGRSSNISIYEYYVRKLMFEKK